MKTLPTTAKVEAKALMLDLMGGVLNAAITAKNLGRSMTPQQRAAIETMTAAIWNCKEAFTLAEVEAMA
jgi:hypothetical protein